MTYIITMANQKGGVGKSTASLNTAYALANTYHKKTLLIDMDAQGSSSLNCGIDVSNDDTNTIDLLLEKLVNGTASELSWDEIQSCIYTPDFADRKRDPSNPMKWIDTRTPFGFDILPSNLYLSVVELEMGLVGGARRTGIRSDYLSKLIDMILRHRNYDFIVIDTPPSLGSLSLNSLAAATSGVIIVSSVDIMSLRGVNTLITTVDTVKKLNPSHRGVLGILLCLYSERRIVDRSIEEWVQEFLPIATFNTRIPETSNVKKANSSMLLVSQIDKKMNKAYADFTGEVIHAVEHPDELVGSAKKMSEKDKSE